MIIGTFNLTESKTYDGSGMYAGHARMIRVPAGTYPIEVKRGQGYTYLSVKMDGVIGHESWSNSQGSKTYPNQGRPAVYNWTPYGHELARVAAEDGVVELEPGYGLTARQFEGAMGPQTLHGFTKDGERISVR